MKDVKRRLNRIPFKRKKEKAVAKRKTIKVQDAGNLHVQSDEKKSALAVAPKRGSLCRIDTVKVTAPARIDLSGGWSDTPPICYDRGGTVMVAGVTLEGVQPIEAIEIGRAHV